MPTKNEVQLHVLNIVHAFTGIIVTDLLNKFFTTALKDPPLSMDDTGLGFMTLSLRGYIKNERPEKTIIVTEVRKPGLTVSGLVDLVFSKLK